MLVFPKLSGQRTLAPRQSEGRVRQAPEPRYHSTGPALRSKSSSSRVCDGSAPARARRSSLGDPRCSSRSREEARHPSQSSSPGAGAYEALKTPTFSSEREATARHDPLSQPARTCWAGAARSRRRWQGQMNSRGELPAIGKAQASCPARRPMLDRPSLRDKALSAAKSHGARPGAYEADAAHGARRSRLASPSLAVWMAPDARLSSEEDGDVGTSRVLR